MNDNETLLYISLDSYLKQWFIHETGGAMPIKLHKSSVESKILRVYLTRCPHNAKPEAPSPDKVAIVLPEFREHPPRIYNYLPDKAKNIFISTIRNRFDIQLFNDMLMISNLAKRQDELIMAWMQAHGIEFTGTNLDTITKRYQRQREVYINNQRQIRFRKNKKCR